VRLLHAMPLYGNADVADAMLPPRPAGQKLERGSVAAGWPRCIAPASRGQPNMSGLDVPRMVRHSRMRLT
jgi:hypothetical protein